MLFFQHCSQMLHQSVRTHYQIVPTTAVISVINQAPLLPRTVNYSVVSVEPTQALLVTMANAPTKANNIRPVRNGTMDVTMNVSVKMETLENTSVTTGVYSQENSTRSPTFI